MKKIIDIVICLMVSAAFISCEGSADPADPAVSVELSADKDALVANGSDIVTFIVKVDGTDVTAKAVIKVGNLAMNGNTYKTSTPGDYTFTAEYQGHVSNSVKVTATVPEAVESQFVKHVAVWEFTGAWCTNCPSGYSNMNYVISRNDLYKKTVHPMAFHSNYSGDDDLALPDNLTDKIMVELEVGDGFPSFITDLRTEGGLVDGTAFRQSLVEAIEEYPSHCGVAVFTELAEDKIEVTAKLYSEKASSYRLAVFVVEDRVKYYQKDGTLTHDDYNHRHVVRKIVSATYKGDRLGEVVAGDEVSKTYSIDVDSAWNLEETYIYVLAINAEGHVNNMNCCMVGENTDYDIL